MSSEESVAGFAPIDFFFSEEVDCLKALKMPLSKKHLLPSLGEVFGDEVFSTLLMGWNESGLFFDVHVKTGEPIAVRYPDFREGDSIELFIDTRRVSLAKTTHRFCHHFFFLPERFEGHLMGECTRFRTEDSHPLVSEEDLEMQVKVEKGGYKASICIPTAALVGYDPQKGAAIGFTYRINRSQGPSQHFAIAHEHAQIDAVPSLWAQVRLV